MNPLIIIQARLNSSRLPGKVLLPLAGRPMLEIMFHNLKQLPWPVVIATPDHEIAHRFKGSVLWAVSENDVAGRFKAVLNIHGPDTFVRLCGDSPLLDPDLVRAAITLYEPPYLEIITPVGCVEVCDTASWRIALLHMTAHEREHVTGPLRPLGRSLHFGSGARLVVDTESDYLRVKTVVAKMDPDRAYGWREICALR
jgi:spore coat polysaccharide biosynthesis protein SpsF (cytidylyltransferase family)